MKYYYVYKYLDVLIYFWSAYTPLCVFMTDNIERLAAWTLMKMFPETIQIMKTLEYGSSRQQETNYCNV